MKSNYLEIYNISIILSLGVMILTVILVAFINYMETKSKNKF